MFEVVQDEETTLSGEEVGKCRRKVGRWYVKEPDRPGDGRKDERLIRQFRQGHHHDTVRERFAHVAGEFDRKPGLAGTGRPYDGREGCRLHDVLQDCKIGFPPDEPGRHVQSPRVLHGGSDHGSLVRIHSGGACHKGVHGFRPPPSTQDRCKGIQPFSVFPEVLAARDVEACLDCGNRQSVDIPQAQGLGAPVRPSDHRGGPLGGVWGWGFGVMGRQGRPGRIHPISPEWQHAWSLAIRGAWCPGLETDQCVIDVLREDSAGNLRGHAIRKIASTFAPVTPISCVNSDGRERVGLQDGLVVQVHEDIVESLHEGGLVEGFRHYW